VDTTGTCQHDGRPVKARGLCSRCYYRWSRYGNAQAPRPRIRRVDPVARFLEQTAPGPVPARRPDLGPCLLWTGLVNGSGYGTAWDGERSLGAHLMAVQLAGVMVFPGEEPDHLCGVRLCVRTEHLEVVTGAENRRRANLLRDEARRQLVLTA